MSYLLGFFPAKETVYKSLPLSLKPQSSASDTDSSFPPENRSSPITVLARSAVWITFFWCMSIN